jgi:subtilisin-like proprotein convertase family protein
MVKAHSHIFYDINPLPIAIGYIVTPNCNTYTNNTALAVPDGTGTNVPGALASKTISVPAPVSTISDVNVTLGFTHTYIEDLVVAINHPDGTQVPLWARNCDNEFSTVLFTFSDGNPTIPSTGCTATSGTFAPAGSLSNFNGKPNNGTWTLLAADYFNGDTGTINNWSIEICSQTFTLANEEFEFQDFNLYPNPNNGSFTIKLASEANDVKILVNDIRGRQVFEKTYNNDGIFDQTINLNNVQAGVYLVTATDGIKKTVRRIIIE